MTIQYDYTHQAWVKDGKYQPCAHKMCQAAVAKGDNRDHLGFPICYGTLHRGLPVAPHAKLQ